MLLSAFSVISLCQIMYIAKCAFKKVWTSGKKMKHQIKSMLNSKKSKVRQISYMLNIKRLLYSLMMKMIKCRIWSLISSIDYYIILYIFTVLWRYVCSDPTRWIFAFTCTVCSLEVEFYTLQRVLLVMGCCAKHIAADRRDLLIGKDFVFLSILF